MGPRALQQTISIKASSAPKRAASGFYPKSVPGGTRTPNLLIRSQMLYPLRYRHVAGINLAERRENSSLECWFGWDGGAGGWIANPGMMQPRWGSRFFMGYTRGSLVPRQPSGFTRERPCRSGRSSQAEAERVASVERDELAWKKTNSALELEVDEVAGDGVGGDQSEGSQENGGGGLESPYGPGARAGEPCLDPPFHEGVQDQRN